jgi:hypothetical protein
MPLRAQLDGDSLDAALLSEAQWQSLKGSRSLRMLCCDAPAYRRTSQLGTRHFAHSPGSHCGAEGESEEHLAAKAEIVRACHEIGWDALSEYVGDKWRADVYATLGRHRLAFEIQWSTQTLEVTRERHAAYGTDVKCCWLFKRLPSLIPEMALPMFRLSLTDSVFHVTIGESPLTADDCGFVAGRTVTLQEFVEARLQGRIRFSNQRSLVVREVQLVVHEVQCSRCDALYDVFYPREIIRSNCGAERDCFALDSLMGNPPPERPIDDLHNALLNPRGIESMFASELKHLRISIKPCRSRCGCWFGCPECDALYEKILCLSDQATDQPFCSKNLPCSERLQDPHWCLPLNGGFCT